jgi:putative DNA primase/helicase
MGAPVFQLHPEAGPAPEEAPAVEVMPPPSDPLAVVRVLLDELTEDDHLKIRRWRGEWWRFQGPHWAEAETEAVRKWLYERLEDARYVGKNKDGEEELKRWSPDKGKLDKLLDAMTAPALLPKTVDAPSWISTGERAGDVVPCQNGLVDVHTQKLREMTPDYFGTVCVPFDYDPDVAAPEEWMRFLHTLWPAEEGQDVAAEILALQEWFGYVLSGRLDLQKILLVIGPPRSGKGTIARVLTDLLGRPNVAAPTLAGMATNFGMQPLLGKTLGIVGDARLQSGGTEVVVERLLSVSGQDSITVDRKNRDAWTGTIPARLMILSNELPKFGDASGAIASRFVVLTLKESFLGREDIDLDGKLRAELPAILKWALDGLVRLNAQRRITEPAASLESVQALADLVSPIKAFIREVCTVDPAEVVPFSEVYREYGEWCRENGRGIKNTAGFSSDLRTALPELKTDHRPKVDGRKLPRHVKGLAISEEWADRIKEGGDYAPGSGWNRGGRDDWHLQEPPAGY